jgi:hypothetical protein
MNGTQPFPIMITTAISPGGNASAIAPSNDPTGYVQAPLTNTIYEFNPSLVSFSLLRFLRAPIDRFVSSCIDEVGSYDSLNVSKLKRSDAHKAALLKDIAQEYGFGLNLAYALSFNRTLR